MKYLIMGTAGHIDHGKTALIKALTGQDTDRLPEEKKRGITLDLGFAHMDLFADEGEKVRVSFIDVPGHEKLISNMVSGVAGMDSVLFTVDAAEGMKPQSYEHLEILDALGVKRGITVITKADLVDEKTLTRLVGEVRRELKGSFLENAPIIATSSVSGKGLAQLRIEICRQAKEILGLRDSEEYEKPARMPVDRVFSLPGFGTVVTGSLLTGRIDKKTKLCLYPGGRSVKIRQIQSCDEEIDLITAGQRGALNLAKIDVKEIHRGMLIASENSLVESRLLNAKIKVSKRFTRELKSGMRLHLLIGSAHLLARIHFFKETEGLKGREHYVQLRLEEAYPATKGERFVLRFYSPLETIGGGEVLHPDALRGQLRDRSGKITGPVKKKGPGPMPEELKKPAAFLMKEFEAAGFHFLSLNNMDLGSFDEKRIARALKYLERSGKLVRLDESHYTTAAIEGSAVELLLRYFKQYNELSTHDFKEMLDTNRTSVRILLEYFDRKKVTRQKGAATVHELVD